MFVSFCDSSGVRDKMSEDIAARPFREGDVLELSGQIGVAMRDEAEGLISVLACGSSETWIADHCRLVVRPE